MKSVEIRETTSDTSSVSKTRNSFLREKTQQIPRAIAEVGTKLFPHITPDDIARQSTKMVEDGAVQATKGHITGSKKDVIVGNIKIAIGSAGDGLDGAWARVMNEKNPGSVDMNAGNWKDPFQDAKQEKAKARASFERAKEQGDHLGAFLALGTMGIRNVPRTLRAAGEWRGIIFPETGGNIIEFFGTRLGSTFLSSSGSLAGGRIQTATEGVSVFANAVNVVARTRRALGKPDPNNVLPQKDRELAKTRTLVMAAVSVENAAEAVLLGMKYYGEMKAKQKEVYDRWHSVSGKQEADLIAGAAINRIEEKARELGIDHRFVGGTLTDLLTPSTKAEYDLKNRVIKLTGHNTHEMFRSSDGTTKDVDMTCYSSDPAKVGAFRAFLSAEKRRALESGEPYPDVNIEPAYYPEQKRNPLTQFVSGVDVDEEGKPSLVFGRVKQSISWQSLEPWRVRLEDGSEITTFSPFAHALCYAMRVPSGYKSKDMEVKYGSGPDGAPMYTKIDLVKRLAMQADESGFRFWREYGNRTYEPWISFINTMVGQKGLNTPDVGMAAKALITRTYWETVGPAFSHGRGVLKPFASMSGAFTGK